jgi:hypothetical protein
MSLIVDNGLVLTDTITTNRNTIDSSGNNLIISSNNGDIRFQTTGEISINKNLNLGNTSSSGGSGQLHKVLEVKGKTTATSSISGGSSGINAGIVLKTNNVDRVGISSTGIINFLTNQPRLNTATSSTTTNQFMSMNNFMSLIDYTPTLYTTSGTATIDATTSYGKYARFGSIVFLTIFIELTSTGTIGTAEEVRIGLPFTADERGVLNISAFNNVTFASGLTAAFDIYPTIELNNYFTLETFDSTTATATTPILGGNITNTSQIAVSGFYFI